MQIEKRPWQDEVLSNIHDVGEDTTIAINAPTGSGKTLLSLKIAEKLGADVIIVGVRTRTEQYRFWDDIHKFNIPYYPLVFFAKNDQCLFRHNRNKDSLEEIENEAEILCSNCKYTSTPDEATEIFEEFREEINNKQKGIERIDELHGLIIEHRRIVVNYLNRITDVFPDTDIGKYRKLIAERLGVNNVCTYALTKNLSYYATLAKIPIVLIGTYPYIFSFPSILFKRLLTNKLKFVTIIDETHNLDNLDFLEIKISTKRLEQIIDYIAEACTGGEMIPDVCNKVDIKKLKEIAKKFGERLNELAKQYGLLDKKNVGVTHKRLCGQDTCEIKVMEELLGMLDEFVEIVDPVVVFENKPDYVGRKVVTSFARNVGIAKVLFRHLQGRLVHPSELPDWVAAPDAWYFYLAVENNVSLVIKPISPKPIITKARKVFRGPWIIMSGTLFNKKYIEDVWGLKITQYFDLAKGYQIIGNEVKKLREKAEIGQMVVKIVSEVKKGEYLTSKFEERKDEKKFYEMSQRYAKKIGEIIASNSDGVFLVVYPNYNMMNTIADYIQRLINGQVTQIREGKDVDMKKLLDLALQNKKLVLHAVAKGRFTEGVELTHNNKSLIKHIIVVGVPIPNISDDYVQDRIKASGYGEREWLEEHARITTLQAIGRGIRYPDDSVTVWLLDYRYDHGPNKYAKKWGIKSRRRKIF
jgi:DNA excision repair protein ERCC-2